MQQEEKTCSRNHSIDFLKCFLMLGVMSLHTVIHGFGYADSLHNDQYIWNGMQSLCEIIAVCVFNVSVNVFFLISGYFGIQYKRRRIKQLLSAMLFYSILSYIISLCVGTDRLSISSVIKNTILGWRTYWFMIVYLIIYMFSDIINNALDGMNEIQWKRFLVLFFLLNTVLGFVLGQSEYGSALSTLPMLFIYCCGRYIKNHCIAAKKIGKWWIYLLSTVINLLICLALLRLKQFYWVYRFSVDYCNPMIVLSALSLFSMIAFLPQQKKTALGSLASRLAPYTLAVYLFTETASARKWVYIGLPFLNQRIGAVSILLYALCLYIIAVGIEIARIKGNKKIRDIFLAEK